ncbi:Eaa protein [Salmonella enterica subsp. enterica serovar Pomona]|nr:Eaa protein [Salmonella enterica subsp. enterica serovar Pomona]
MTTITKERIELFIKNPLENGLTRGEQMELARIAMASLEAKPVRYLNKFSGVCVTLEQQSNAADDVAVYIPLYTAQPVPVVPDEMATSDDMNLYQKSFAQGYNACRNAMLNGGKS